VTHSKLTRELATTFANVALAHVTREYPGKMDHILTGPADIASPRTFHRVQARMKELFGSDVNCQALEPNGNDFHSPLLIEMECMRRALDPVDFLKWVERFLPRLEEREPRTLFEPVKGIDQSDPQTVHLHGLNFSRAWCWRRFSRALPNGDMRREIALNAAEAHILASLPHITGDYMGEHWLATYAMLALSA